MKRRCVAAQQLWTPTACFALSSGASFSPGGLVPAGRSDVFSVISFLSPLISCLFFFVIYHSLLMFFSLSFFFSLSLPRLSSLNRFFHPALLVFVYIVAYLSHLISHFPSLISHPSCLISQLLALFSRPPPSCSFPHLSWNSPLPPSTVVFFSHLSSIPPLFSHLCVFSPVSYTFSHLSPSSLVCLLSLLASVSSLFSRLPPLPHLEPVCVFYRIL